MRLINIPTLVLPIIFLVMKSVASMGVFIRSKPIDKKDIYAHLKFNLLQVLLIAQINFKTSVSIYRRTSYRFYANLCAQLSKAFQRDNLVSDTVFKSLKHSNTFFRSSAHADADCFPDSSRLDRGAITIFPRAKQ
jgi:hypothetical protein